MSFQNDVATRQLCVNTTSCQYDVVSKCGREKRYGVKQKKRKGVVATRRRAKTTSCQDDAVSKRSGVNTTSCHHDVVSTWCRIKMAPCQLDSVSTRHRVKPTHCLNDCASTRRRIKTTSCEHGVVPICCRANNGVVPTRCVSR